MDTAIKLSSLRTDGLQVRAAIDPATVAEYAEAMRGGAVFPPVVAFYDGAAYWLADGFHRGEAAKVIGAESINADVRDGDRRAALLYAVGANATHGLRRTNADKRRAVETLLADPEWSKWSNREIAKACGCTHPFVAKVRDILIGPPAAEMDNADIIDQVAKQLRDDLPGIIEHIEKCDDIAELKQIRDTAHELQNHAAEIELRNQRETGKLLIASGNDYQFPNLPELPRTHPVADIWPMCDAALIYSIADSIREMGQLQPIIMIDGAILDGRARWLACKIAGVEPVTEEWTPRSETDSPIRASFSLNYFRGNYGPSQRAVIAVRMEELLAAEKAGG